MSTALVKTNEQPVGLRNAVKRLTNNNDIIRAVLPNLPGASTILSSFQDQPKNIIRVVLNDDGTKISPGETLHGTVKLILSEPVVVESLTVSLYGRSETYISRMSASRNLIKFRSSFELVDVATNIELEQTLKPKIYEYPFKITLPRTVEFPKQAWPYDEQTLRFNDNLVQSLPGSFEAWNPHESKSSECSIKYWAIAKLVAKDQPALEHRRLLKVVVNNDRTIMAGEELDMSLMKCSFEFKPNSPKASPRQSTMADAPKSSAILSPTRGPGSKIKEMFHLRSHSESFDLYAEIPRAGRLSLPLEIILRLSWHRSDKGDMSFPVTLKTMQVELVARSIYRANIIRTYKPEEDFVYSRLKATDTYHSKWDSKPIVISELKNLIEKLDNETRTSTFMFIRPVSVLPAFKTFNITREYILKVLCDIECAGRSFQAKYEIENFDILAEGNVDDDFFEKRQSSEDTKQARGEGGDAAEHEDNK